MIVGSTSKKDLRQRKMTEGQLDELRNLIHALSGRIADLERETEELRFRTDNTENAIDNLKWEKDNGY